MADRHEDSDTYPRWLSITGESLDLDLPNGLLGKCRSIDDYKKLNHLGEGTYGVVYRAHDLTTTSPHTVVALKQMRLLDRDRSNGMPITSIREIALLRSIRHPNIISVLDVAVGKDMADVYMVMEYAEQDMAHLLDDLRVKFTLSEVKNLTKQLLEGVEYIHRNNIIHRDIKMSNLLYNSKGQLKLADFGMARHFSHRPLTPDVVTVWYRPPEILLGCVRYTKSTDMWSCGLIIGELLVLVPLLPGETELEQLSLIVKFLNPPTDETWPKMRLLPKFSGQVLFRKPAEERDSGSDSKNGNISLEKRFWGHTVETVNLLKDILQWDPERRLTAKKALDHRWFRSEEPKAKDTLMMPTFPELRRGQGVSDMMDAMVVDEDLSAGVSGDTDYGGGGRSGWGGDEAGKGKGRGGGGKRDYGDVAEGGGAAASMAEKVTRRGAEQAGRGGVGPYLFDFGEGQVERKGRHGDHGGRAAKKLRH
ncbi:kinase-like domain-containing protein [Terfezia claveryi]|nr:kinase-like domain-containing protein [Terfezia claveryi]